MRFPMLLPVLTLAACTGSAPDAPSLLPRPIETRAAPVTDAAEAPVPADATLDANIATRVAAFRVTAAAFTAVHGEVASRIERARGAREGSAAWLDAQGALGELQQARTAADAALVDLEALAIARAGEGQRPYPDLDAAITDATAEVERQQAIEAALKATAAPA